MRVSNSRFCAFNEKPNACFLIDALFHSSAQNQVQVGERDLSRIKHRAKGTDKPISQVDARCRRNSRNHRTERYVLGNSNKVREQLKIVHSLISLVGWVCGYDAID